VFDANNYDNINMYKRFIWEGLMMSNEKSSLISELQKKAELVYKLKQERRQKRPIVIEFSGSPKSGKTSCINSLEIFLKRNGFTVKTIQERAGVCPVTDKMNPMFNLWTACTSLSGMIGTLENKKDNVDVLILDRGIYDSLCWFNWLVEKGKMEKEQQKIIEDFLLMNDFVKSIDIVFSFTTTPETSIAREYASLLTDKKGSIMNVSVLSEYRDSVFPINEKKAKYFHKIFPIDTTDKFQDDVGKEVTTLTLDELRDMLIEKIGIVEKNDKLSKLLGDGGIFDFSDVHKSLGRLDFRARDEAEELSTHIQPIPIAMIVNKQKDKVLIVKKNHMAVTDDSPEKGKSLVYVGGHTRYEDSTEIMDHNFLEICRSTLKREVKEEIGISVALNDITPFVVYATDTEKSKKHLGICFVVEQDIDELRLKLDSSELVQKKGTSKSGSFLTLDEVRNEELESWSKQLIDHFLKINPSGQISLDQYMNNNNEA